MQITSCFLILTTLALAGLIPLSFLYFGLTFKEIFSSIKNFKLTLPELVPISLTSCLFFILFLGINKEIELNHKQINVVSCSKEESKNISYNPCLINDFLNS